MLQLLVAMMIAAAPGNGSIGENRIILRDHLQGATPITDKDLRPVKLPDCRSEAEAQHTAQLLKQGEPGECFIRDMKVLQSRR